MGLWGPVNAFNLERVGPWADVVVGTEGRYTDLNQAVSDGFTRIILAAGAVLTANLTWNINNGFMWASQCFRGPINLGAYRLIVTGTHNAFAGFGINGATGVGFTIASGYENTLERVSVENCTSHGFELTTSDNDNVFDRCFARSNTGDGFKTAVGADYTRIVNSRAWNNAYGVNDLADTGIVVACNLIGNVTAAFNPASTGTTKAGNRTT